MCGLRRAMELDLGSVSPIFLNRELWQSQLASEATWAHTRRMELDEALSSLAESLREERTRAGLTLEQLAQRSDLSTAHLSRLESGDRQPSVAALISLSRALGVSMSTLLGERRGVAGHRRPPLRGVSTHEANGLTLAACSGFPGSSTLEALQIRIEADRAPSEPARPPGRGVDLRGERAACVSSSTGRCTCSTPAARSHFDANRPHRLGSRAGHRRGPRRGGRRTQRLPQPPPVQRIHQRPLRRPTMTMLTELEGTGRSSRWTPSWRCGHAPARRCT